MEKLLQETQQRLAEREQELKECQQTLEESKERERELQLKLEEREQVTQNLLSVVDLDAVVTKEDGTTTTALIESCRTGRGSALWEGQYLKSKTSQKTVVPNCQLNMMSPLSKTLHIKLSKLSRSRPGNSISY